MERYELGTAIRLSFVFRDINGVLTNPTTVTIDVHRPDGTVTAIAAGSINNPSIGNYNCFYTSVIEGEHAYTATGETPVSGYVDVKSGFFYVIEYVATDVDELIPIIRFYMGDYNPPYRYTTNTLREALVFSIRLLMRRWRSKYKVDSAGSILRNPSCAFEFAAPPTIQYKDEPPIVIQAAIALKSGVMQEASWQVASWRDDEIAVSNIQADRSRQALLQRDMEMLEDYFKRRLYAGARAPLPGFNYPPNFREG